MPERSENESRRNERVSNERNNLLPTPLPAIKDLFVNKLNFNFQPQLPMAFLNLPPPGSKQKNGWPKGLGNAPLQFGRNPGLGEPLPVRNRDLRVRNIDQLSRLNPPSKLDF